MLNKLLDSISESRIFRLSDLAQDLGVTEELVGQMIEHLARLGYIKEAGSCAGEACTACGLAESCTPSRVKMWVRTEKKWKKDNQNLST